MCRAFLIVAYLLICVPRAFAGAFSLPNQATSDILGSTSSQVCLGCDLWLFWLSSCAFVHWHSPDLLGWMAARHIWWFFFFSWFMILLNYMSIIGFFCVCRICGISQWETSQVSVDMLELLLVRINSDFSHFPLSVSFITDGYDDYKIISEMPRQVRSDLYRDKENFQKAAL